MNLDNSEFSLQQCLEESLYLYSIIRPQVRRI